MDAKAKEVLNEFIASNKCQFVIPVFQRNYDWRIKDCHRLFNDIIDLAEDNLHKDRKHFMGAFVCKFNKFVDTSFNQYVLIDGQQRLTSITLILKALYDYLAIFGDKYEEMRSEIKETYLINKFAKDYNLRLKLKPNKIDNENFNKLMDDDEVDLDSIIGRNYTEFKKMISNMQVSIEDFYNALQRLEVVAVFLGDDDNPQVIFESLNSTGLELTDADLIRNYLLMNCKAEEQEYLYKNYWLKIENLLEDNFLQFIKDLLSLKNGVVTSSTKNYTYQTFQKYFIKQTYDKKQFLENLLYLAHVYNQLYVPNMENRQLQNALKDFVSLDIKTTYPFVFGLLIDNKEKKINDESLIKILKLLESYLIRRNVCNLAGGGLSQVMASLYNDLKLKYGDKFYIDPYKKVSNALAGITTKAYFPKDDEFIRELITRDMYHNRNIFFILKTMEMSSQNKEIIDFDKLSIEHIMPQTLSKEWINYLQRKDWEEFHKENVHKIGNLTLTAYNSEMSNKLFEEKKCHIEFSRLTLNRYFNSINSWNTQESIDNRGDILSKIAVKLWPYPAVTNIEDIATESHFLLEDDNYEYTGTKPAGIQIGDEKIIANSWTDLFISVLSFLYNYNKTLFLSVITKLSLFGTEKEIFSKNKSSLRYPNEFEDDYYVEVNSNTEFKIKIMKILFAQYRFSPDEILIFIK